MSKKSQKQKNSERRKRIINIIIIIIIILLLITSCSAVKYLGTIGKNIRESTHKITDKTNGELKELLGNSNVNITLSLVK